uniref:Late embryogenesis abundant protein LEA-2 subgroup domain-containing protein n=1 Tax=Oryza rufipogon TaxID=4529 RepID=A0A0E0PFT3_ORYRU
MDYHRIHPVGVDSPPPAPDSQQQVGKGRSTASYGAAADHQATPVRAGPAAAAAAAVQEPRAAVLPVRVLCWTLLAVLALAGLEPEPADREVTATSPNRRIGIYYDSLEVTASFNGTELCRGGFPTLYQGHRHPARRRDTAGQRRGGEAAQQVGFVPLTVWARVLIRIKFGTIKLWKMTGKATCNLVVDNLIPLPPPPPAAAILLGVLGAPPSLLRLGEGTYRCLPLTVRSGTPLNKPVDVAMWQLNTQRSTRPPMDESHHTLRAARSGQAVCTTAPVKSDS